MTEMFFARPQCNHSYAFSMASRDSKQKVCANYPGLLIDTCATSHIVRDDEKFVSFNDDFNADEHTIELADGTQSHAAKQRGTAKMLIDSCAKLSSRMHYSYLDTYVILYSL